MEDKVGSIEPGKLADLAVLNKDYFAVADGEIKQIRSVMTIVDSKIVFGLLRRGICPYKTEVAVLQSLNPHSSAKERT